MLYALTYIMMYVNYFSIKLKHVKKEEKEELKRSIHSYRPKAQANISVFDTTV